MTAYTLALLLVLPALGQGGPPMPPAPPSAPSAPPAPGGAPSSGGGASSDVAGPSAAQADAPARHKKKDKAPAVEESTSGVKALGVDDVYGGAKLRDPFMKLAGAGAVAAPVAAPAKDFDPEDFSIHQLELKGVMRDKAGMSAMLVDMNTHFSFILRGGRLYDMRKKPVPGVTGVIQPAQKSVTLTTADKDVQTLRLGEDANEAEE